MVFIYREKCQRKIVYLVFSGKSGLKAAFFFTMRSITEDFYKTSEWRNARRLYLLKHPFCEECLKRGEYTPATHVHHRVFLNKANYTNPEFSLNEKNLEAVCLDCHNTIHFGKSEKRYRVNADGTITALYN